MHRRLKLVKISRIVCCCDDPHEVLRVRPISARRFKTARLHTRAMECWWKRGTSHASEPEFAGRIARLCMSRKSGLADSSYVRKIDNPYIWVSIPSSPNNAYSSGDSSVQQGVLLTVELHSPAKYILVAGYDALMLFGIVFDVEAFQLYKLLEPKFT